MSENHFNHILMKLPGEIGKQLRLLPEEVLLQLEEIRIKRGQAIMILSGGKEFEIGEREIRIDKSTIIDIFNNILNHSAYAYQEEIANGYLTIEGGHRVGLCGRAVLENGKVKTIKDISSLNIRRSREMIGVSDRYIPLLLGGKNEMLNTLIVSPPKCGKTTLLRDMIRNLSNMGFRIGVCDERSEITATYNGITGYDLGKRTDVLDGCPKDQGMLMLLRSMSPDIIATDEIGKPQDISAIESILCAGISILTTVHGKSYDDVIGSKIGELVQRGAFQRFLFLSNTPRVGTVCEIRNFKEEYKL